MHVTGFTRNTSRAQLRHTSRALFLISSIVARSCHWKPHSKLAESLGGKCGAVIEYASI